MTEFVVMIAINLVTPKARAKHKHLFNKHFALQSLQCHLKVGLHNSDYRSKLVPFEEHENIFYI